MRSLDPATVLDDAAALTPGLHLVLEFPTADQAARFKWRLYAARRRMRQKAERELPASDPQWGLSPWEEVSIHHTGLAGLLLLKPAPVDATVTEEINT